MVNGFSMYRQDRNSNGGGIACYVKSSIPHRYRSDCAYNDNGIENITLQLKFTHESIFIILIYRPPNVQVRYLNVALDYICEKCLHECRSIYIIGDLNVNFWKNPNPLNDVLDIFSLTNVVHEPTCF